MRFEQQYPSIKGLIDGASNKTSNSEHNQRGDENSNYKLKIRERGGQDSQPDYRKLLELIKFELDGELTKSTKKFRKKKDDVDFVVYRDNVITTYFKIFLLSVAIH